MKTTKMSLANMKGKLSRADMKNIMAGVTTTGGLPVCNCNSADDCTATNELCMSSCEAGTTGKAGHCGCP